MGHFQSYIRLLPVRLEEARGHIAESTWGRFLWLAGRLRSRFPDLNEPDKLLRAVLFTSAQRTMVDSLYQLFKAPSPGPVSGARAAGGVSSAAVPLSSASVFLVVPVSVGPSFSGSGSASVIEVGDSDLAASDTGIPVSSVSVGSSVVPASAGPLFLDQVPLLRLTWGTLVWRFLIPGFSSVGTPFPSADDMAGGVESSVVQRRLEFWFLFRLYSEMTWYRGYLLPHLLGNTSPAQTPQ